MSDRDRLAALLADLFPAAERARWPFTVDLAADRLIAAGVGFVTTPAATANPDETVSLSAPALDVERLARALTRVAGTWLPQESIDMLAPMIAAEYAALAEPRP